MGNKTLYKPFKYKGKGVYKFSVYVKNEEDKPKLIHFGHKKYDDYTTHQDEKRRKSYLARAKGIKNKKGELTWNNKNTKNYWSVHYLWNG
tara:strand:- start:303 stop:572 length:270 start_codon:yes stop_codon:yes gene_type:complete